MDSGIGQEVGYFIKPKTGRNQSFETVLGILAISYNHPIVMVVTGCIRNTTEESRYENGFRVLYFMDNQVLLIR